MHSTEMVFDFELSEASSTQRAVLVPLVLWEYVTENEHSIEEIEIFLVGTDSIA